MDYFRARRLVFGVLITLLLAQFLYWLSVPQLAAGFSRNPWFAAQVMAVPMGLMITAMVIKSRVVSTLVQTLLIAQYLYEFIGQ